MRTMRHLAIAAVTSLLGGSALAAGGEAKLPGQSGRDYKPREFPEAVLHGRIGYLGADRDWERLDVWVPKDKPQPRMPCLVNLYGGGYGGKVVDVTVVRSWLAKGWVLAQPDYVLGSNLPVPLCSWDVADAIRYLRANADRFSIDPERIGVVGWSAGGWIAQDLFYTSTDRTAGLRYTSPDNKRRWHPLPMRNPHPGVAPEQSFQVQGVVSDWGCGKLWDRRNKTLHDWVRPAVPPLCTVYGPRDEMGTRPGLPEAGQIVNPITALKALGVPARAAYEYPGNTHVAKFTGPVKNEDGSESTWGDTVARFLDDNVKNPTVATAPEMRPPGGIINGPTPVTLLTVHPTGRIHYALDGADPTSASPVYKQPVTVAPGQTLKAIVVREGLKSSRVAVGTFTTGPPSPRITNVEPRYEAAAGKPFELRPKAESADGVTWAMAGICNGLSCDPATGVVSGTPHLPIACPIVVWCYRSTGRQGPIVADARRTVIVIKPAAPGAKPDADPMSAIEGEP